MKRAKNKNDLCTEYVRGLFNYNPLTGFLTHKERFGVITGERAGYINSGYRSVKINQIAYLEHRIIWLYVTGEWPLNEVDHKNLNKQDNSWNNLRQSSRKQNSFNGPTRKRKYGSLKGAFYHKNYKRWQSAIGIDNKIIYLGWFDSEIDAHDAYCEAALKYCGEFARISNAA